MRRCALWGEALGAGRSERSPVLGATGAAVGDGTAPAMKLMHGGALWCTPHGALGTITTCLERTCARSRSTSGRNGVVKGTARVPPGWWASALGVGP